MVKQHFGLVSGLVVASLLVSACALPQPGGDREQRAAPPTIARTLVILAGGEIQNYAVKELVGSGTTAASAKESFKVLLNAGLVLRDERGLPRPYLAETVPEFRTDSWRVSPDGTMETVYRLKPSLTWHDGQPLTAQDFVFAWRIYETPHFGVSRTGGFALVDDVAAPDLRTVVIRWKQVYPDAVVDTEVLPPLPRHLLESSFQQLELEAFLGLRFWRDEYVGAGPWRLERREPGAFVEANAFDGFVFGRPKIERVRQIYTPDPATAVAMMLGGEAHYSSPALLDPEEGIALEQQWESIGGTVFWEAFAGRSMMVQQRPEFAVPQQLATDVRVRRAIAHAIDLDGITEATTDGRGLVRRTYTHPFTDYYENILSAVATRYAYDPRRAEQLLLDAGFSRASDGFWVTPSRERFSLEQWHLPGSANQQESVLVIDSLRRVGIDASSHLWGIQRTSNEDRAKTSGLFAGAANETGFLSFHSDLIARPENRWTGANRIGYSNPEFDRLLDSFRVTLDRSERVGVIAQLERIASDELPAILLYYRPRAVAHVRQLKGVVNNLTPDAGNERNMWLWEWQS